VCLGLWWARRDKNLILSKYNLFRVFFLSVSSTFFLNIRLRFFFDGTFRSWHILFSIKHRCDQKNVIYQADVRTVNSVMSYYGLTENEFKKRCSTHRSSFRNIPKRHTTLSSYIWKLKDKRTPHYVNWSIKARGHPFSSGGRACDLCLTEKLVILTADQNATLNKRDELLETCRHRRKHLLVSLFKPPEEEEPPDTTIK